MKVSDAGEAPIKSDTKANAVERAKEFAKIKVIAKVAIHKKEGTLQTKHTYGKDPICLQYLVKAINPRKAVAVGRTAQRALEKVGISPFYVRHPSRGGSAKFAEGIKQVMTSILRWTIQGKTK